MNILSLFDGISGAMIALKKANIDIDNYYASEIDKHCLSVSNKNFPNIIQLGDVKKINFKNLPKIDLLIGGSPCQDLSNAFKGSGLKGNRSSLLFEFLKIKKKINPRFFLLENVQNKWKKTIDSYTGVEGIIINSQNFTAQSRPRCYWTNIQIPQHTKICNEKIIDIIQEGIIDEKYFFNKKLVDGINLVSSNNSKENGIKKIYDIPRNLLKDNERQRRVYSPYGKSPTLLARSDSAKIYFEKRLRKLTPLECERLQGIEDNYTSILSNTQRYKAIGNGFTIPVITHILKNIKLRKIK